MRIPRVLASLATVAILGAVVAPAALAAGGPVDRGVFSYDDPAFEAGEAAAVSDMCGFAVAVDGEGHNRWTVFPEDGRGVFILDHYAARLTYTNVETGVTVQLRDIGPDRYLVRDGHLYIAVTGRSSFSNVIGVWMIDAESGEVVKEAGRAWDFYGTLCDELAG